MCEVKNGAILRERPARVFRRAEQRYRRIGSDENQQIRVVESLNRGLREIWNAFSLHPACTALYSGNDRIIENASASLSGNTSGCF
jgi:hypothetical protein